ncbi:hypothetical protein JB92DRAFT_3181118 [Gautieria morchelliformis]|nr:hypothetical protein JB92DRAFT_3181118 [Gautieria morchelliformis]
MVWTRIRHMFEPEGVFKGCLAHIDLTFWEDTFNILCITGVIIHYEACLKQNMQWLPAVPLHEHQLNDAIQSCNDELLHAGLYNGQSAYNPQKANIRYKILPSDACRLYRKHSWMHGIDTEKQPQDNVDAWLDLEAQEYKPKLAVAVFYYRPRVSKEDFFHSLRICILTADMIKAAWKYTHHKQLVLNGTFGICDSQILPFIALGVDEAGKGVPLAFFLFSAPTGTKATHAGYDTLILHELLKVWRDSLGALVLVWPDITLLLCKFHICQCWTNWRKKGLCLSQIRNFPKQQVHARLQALEELLLLSVDYHAAQELMAQEWLTLTNLKTLPEMIVAANAGLKYLNHLTEAWMPVSLWHAWSHKGLLDTSVILHIPVEGDTNN